MNTIQKTVAKLLEKRDKLTSSECDLQIEKIGSRLEIIRARNADICDATNTAGKILGKTRRRVTELGSPAELIALDDECRILSAEDDSLCFQRNSLRERVKKAVVEESPALVKAAIKKLAPALKKAEAAQKAYNDSVVALETIKNDIRAQKRIAADAGIEAPLVTPKDFDRMAKLLGWDYSKPVFISESNVRNARADRRAELTGWTREQPVEPKMPWQRVERRRETKV